MGKGLIENIWKKQEKKEARRSEKEIQEFVTKAIKGPTSIQTKILEIADLYDALIKAPLHALFPLGERMAGSDPIDLLRSKSLDVAPNAILQQMVCGFSICIP